MSLQIKKCQKPHSANESLKRKREERSAELDLKEREWIIRSSLISPRSNFPFGLPFGFRFKKNSDTVRAPSPKSYPKRLELREPRKERF